MPVIKKIVELVGVHPTEGDLGVEIEVEGRYLPSPEYLGKYWRVDSDNSLKGVENAEYVTPTPVSLEEIKKALDILGAAYKRRGSIIDDSIRAGVHVHRNVQELTLKQLFTLVCVYYCLEDILIKWCGAGREGNHFCLRTQDAEYIIFALINAIETRKLANLKTDNIRYASLNFVSLFKYGSLEFRGMRGTSDLSLIYKWAQIIDDLYHSSLGFDNPKEVLMSLSGEGELNFLKQTLPTSWKFVKCEGYEELIREACRRVQIFAFSTDWDSFEKPRKNPFVVNQPQLDDYIDAPAGAVMNKYLEQFVKAAPPAKKVLKVNHQWDNDQPQPYVGLNVGLKIKAPAAPYIIAGEFPEPEDGDF